MSQNSNIEWTQATLNFLVGCSKISPGCQHCYAIQDVHRMAGNPNSKIAAANQGLTIIQGGEANWTGKVRFVPERLDIPLRRRKPTMYFVNSLSDLFHEDVPDEVIDQAFAVMALCPQHTFQVLTKRAERMQRYMTRESLMLEWGFHAAAATGHRKILPTRSKSTGWSPERS